MDNSALSLDQEKVIFYLEKYGNTRETDLINFGVKKLSLSEDRMKQLVDDMVLYGRLERVIHEELEPLVTYLKKGATIPLELELQALSHSIGRGQMSLEEIEEAKRILDRTEKVAEKRAKRKTTGKK